MAALVLFIFGVLLILGRHWLWGSVSLALALVVLVAEL